MIEDSSSCACVDVVRPDAPTAYSDFPIGKDTTGNFTLSYKGIAIRSDCNRYTAFHKRSNRPNERVRLYDVTGLTIPGCDCFIYRVPVKYEHVNRGDLLLISDCPFQVLYVEAKEDDRISGITSSGEEIRYLPPIRLGDCSRFIRIFSVLDAIGPKKATEMDEDEIAFVAALLCCRTSTGDLGKDLLASTIAANVMNRPGANSRLPLLLALQQCQCLESFVLTRALEGRIDDPYLPPPNFKDDEPEGSGPSPRGAKPKGGD